MHTGRPRRYCFGRGDGGGRARQARCAGWPSQRLPRGHVHALTSYFCGGGHYRREKAPTPTSHHETCQSSWLEAAARGRTWVIDGPPGSAMKLQHIHRHMWPTRARVCGGERLRTGGSPSLITLYQASR
eukprot:256102-Prymnesium_polylepis.1